MTLLAARRGVFATVAVVLVIALASFFWWPHENAGASVETEVTFTPTQEARYLAEMKENLDGYPNHPRFGLVASEVLVQQGVSACQWLAMQPARGHARREPAVRTAYFAGHPRVIGEWPFKQGRTSVREEILTNSWVWLCDNIADDHIDQSPPPEESD